MENESTGGVYVITVRCGGTEKYYVGKSVDIRKRWKQHTTDMRRRNHRNILMQRAWDKYGEMAFSFCPIFMHSANGLANKEQELLDLYRSEFGDARILNILMECTETRLGVTHSAATKAMLSLRQKENWQDPVYREKGLKLLKSNWGNPEIRERFSKSQASANTRLEVIENKRQAALDKWADPVKRQNILDGLARSQPQRTASVKKALSSPEIREAMSAAQKIAQNRPDVKAKIAATFATPESKEKRSRASTIAHSSDEARQKQRELQKIAQNRPETKAKKSAGVKAALSTEESKQRRRETNARPEVKARRSAAAKAVAAARKAKREAAAHQ